MTLPLFDREPIRAVPSKQLRKYQLDAINLLYRRHREGKRRMLLVAPCGSGKMVMYAHLLKNSSGEGHFLAHRQELIDQCARELHHLGIHSLGVMRGDDDRTNPDASIQVASIQTYARRKKRPPGLIIVDEAHRSASDQYLEHVFEAFPQAVIIGGTATPFRLDGRPLGGKLYETLDVVATYDFLFNASYIVKPDCYSAPEQADLSGVKVREDFDETQLAIAMNTRRLVGQLLDHWLRLAHLHAVFNDKGQRVRGTKEGERRRTFIFAVDIAHSKSIVETFRRAGISTEHLDGETPDRHRKGILEALDGGEVEVVSNCNILLEGVDIPRVKCAVHARPTHSRVLWTQSTMRASRPWCPICRPRAGEPSRCPGGPGHESVVPLLLDHAGNWDRLGPPFEDVQWSLETKPFRKSITPTKCCPKCFAYIDAGRILCPHCHYEFPQQSIPRAVKESPETLALRSTEPQEMKRAFYEKMVADARGAGFKPGYAAAKYKERYGSWPPGGWSDQTKAGFASDAVWVERIARRQARKAQEAPAAAPAPVAEQPVAEYRGLYGDDEEAFADWTERMGF